MELREQALASLALFTGPGKLVRPPELPPRAPKPARGEALPPAAADGRARSALQVQRAVTAPPSMEQELRGFALASPAVSDSAADTSFTSEQSALAQLPPGSQSEGDPHHSTVTIEASQAPRRSNTWGLLGVLQRAAQPWRRSRTQPEPEAAAADVGPGRLPVSVSPVVVSGVSKLTALSGHFDRGQLGGNSHLKHSPPGSPSHRRNMRNLSSPLWRQATLAAADGGAGASPVLSLKVLLSAGEVCAFHVGGGLEASHRGGAGRASPRWEYFLGDRPHCGGTDAAGRRPPMAQLAAVEEAAQPGEAMLSWEAAALLGDAADAEPLPGGVLRLVRVRAAPQAAFPGVSCCWHFLSGG